MPAGTKLVPLMVNRKMSPEGYNRDVRHYEFETKGTGLTYGSGDCLSILPHNKKDQTWEFLDKIGVNPNALLEISSADGSKTELPSKMPAG